MRTRRTSGTGLKALVDDYIRWTRPERECDLSKFQGVETDEDAISYAALARDPETGEKHPHQHRIPDSTLEKSKRRLLKNLSQVRSATSFESSSTSSIASSEISIGSVSWPSTTPPSASVRALGREPEKVYVHRGTRDGIRKLDSDLANRETIEMDELPAPIRKLKPREAEDFLCVYKDKLSRT